ncbi:inter-alpha-trypsin inhibitor-like [Hyla sarda]|uniref:inter-alpha-trypsin inhibitor-like n=1 Tax=Hyla sarda TaxID=327740 RepID=UPI0024C35E16|nr:inter-alpha-trypsin inhibitor-like [Hyla sarda]
MSSSMLFFGSGLTLHPFLSSESRCGVAVLEDSAGTEDRWTYDQSQDSCRKILLKDSRDGSNIFRTEKECLSICSEAYTREAACDLPQDRGPCMALFMMWYYDQERGLCDTFFYGGCQGNGNRFENRMECINTCVVPKKGRSGYSDVSQDSEPSGSGTDAGLVVGVIFGVIFGVAFLVTLGMYLVQRKKLKKQKHKRVPDTEMK